MKNLLGKYGIYLLALTLSLHGCKDPFEPPETAAGKSLLVVEGFLNAGDGGTVVRLSYSRPFSGEGAIRPENDAVVNVEDEQGNIYQLQSPSQELTGEYIAEELPLQPGGKYRLRIRTGEGNEYLSELVEVKPTPDIDGIGWELKDGGVQVYVNTHDASGNTRYYRWEYDETWEFHATYRSLYKYHEEDNEVRFREEEEAIYTCWDGAVSTGVITGSTTRLTEDVVYKQPLVFAPRGSRKMSELYSILVRQYAMTREAFEYWETMKKNTEDIGSVFDPLPSNLRGNIYNTTDPSEQVIGYISAGSVKKKRIFIDNDDLPADWNIPRSCEMRQVPLDSLVFFFKDEVYIPLGEWYKNTGLAGYNATIRGCADCTLEGVTRKPDFWPR